MLSTCQHNGIPIQYDLNENDIIQKLSSYDLVIDSLLGFSFKPPLREPYKTVIESF